MKAKPPMDWVALAAKGPPPPKAARGFRFEGQPGKEWLILTWGGYDYEIEFSRIRTPLDLIQWLIHLCEKEWKETTAKEIGSLCEKICVRRGWPIGPIR